MQQPGIDYYNQPNEDTPIDREAVCIILIKKYYLIYSRKFKVTKEPF